MVGIAPLVIFLLFFVSPSGMKPLYATQFLLVVVTAHRCLFSICPLFLCRRIYFLSVS